MAKEFDKLHLMRVADQENRPHRVKLRIIALLRKYRQASGLGAREFEAKLGKGRQWLDRRDKYALDVADLFAALEVLNLDPADFMREVFDKTTETDDRPAQTHPAMEAAAKRWAQRGEHHED